MENTHPSTDLEQKLPYGLEQVRARTPSRILTGRAGGSYLTTTLLELRADHAAARDAVTTDFDLVGGLGPDLVAQWGLFEIITNARSKQEFLLRPDLGRALDESAKAEIQKRCPAGADIQIVLGDGLSAAAVIAQVPALLPLLHAETSARGWRF